MTIHDNTWTQFNKCLFMEVPPVVNCSIVSLLPPARFEFGLYRVHMCLCFPPTFIFLSFFMRIITKVILLCGYKWYFKDLLLQLNWIFSSHLKTWKSFLDAFKWVGSNSNTMAQLRTGVTSMKKHSLNCVHVL